MPQNQPEKKNPTAFCPSIFANLQIRQHSALFFLKKWVVPTSDFLNLPSTSMVQHQHINDRASQGGDQLTPPWANQGGIDSSTLVAGGDGPAAQPRPWPSPRTRGCAVGGDGPIRRIINNVTCPPSLLECFEKVSGGLNSYGVLGAASPHPHQPHLHRKRE